jgi:hypothetical protein
MSYTWSARYGFLSNDFERMESGSTPRAAMEKTRANHVSAIADIDRILATSGPEDAAEIVRLEIAEAHPQGMNRHCNCSHRADVFASRRPYGAPTEPPETVPDSFLRRVRKALLI